MLKTFTNTVLASLRVSTYRRDSRRLDIQGIFPVRQNPLRGRTARTKGGMYLFVFL